MSKKVCINSYIFISLASFLHLGVPPNLFSKLVCCELKKVENHCSIVWKPGKKVRPMDNLKTQFTAYHFVCEPTHLNGLTKILIVVIIMSSNFARMLSEICSSKFWEPLIKKRSETNFFSDNMCYANILDYFFTFKLLK